MRRRVGGIALPASFCLDLCALAVPFDLVLQRPRAALGRPEPVPETCPQDVAATAAEIRRLLTAFTHPQHPGEHYQHGSRWRRHHQAQARQSHYQRTLTNQPLPMRC